VSDRYGLRPIYWTRTERRLAYAGEVKSLLESPDARKVIDPRAIVEWLSFGYLLENRTWISGLELVPPATVIEVSDRGVKQALYWSWDKVPQRGEGEKAADLVVQLGTLWKDAVRRRANGRGTGQLLSGGLDSRAILAAIPSA